MSALIHQILIADRGSFVTIPLIQAELILGGIAHDRHCGLQRRSCARTPWHKRGTIIANTRQISIVSIEECADIAIALGVRGIEPRLLGANLVTQGIDDLSRIAPGSRLIVPSGATLFVTEENVPCRKVASLLARELGEQRVASAFVKAAMHRRGLVAMVESAGTISHGDAVRLVSQPGHGPQPRRDPQSGTRSNAREEPRLGERSEARPRT